MNSIHHVHTRGSFQFPLQPAQAWMAILGFILVTCVLMAVGLGRFLNLLFPAGAVVISSMLYLRHPILYNGFCWWIWFLAPLVRRIADYSGGFTNPSPILLTPLLASLFSAITFLRSPSKLIQKDAIPYFFVVYGIMYGLMIGTVKAASPSTIVALLTWITPVLFSFHLFRNWRNYPAYRKNIQRVFLWITLISGIYGIFQYITAPSWDVAWLNNISAGEVTSFGVPEPLGLRVWSTMHGPGVFSQVMMACLLLLLSNVGLLTLPATTFGYLSFLLSAVRSAWLGWLLGLLGTISVLKPRFQMRLGAIISIASVCVIPLTIIEPFSSVIVPRLESFGNLLEDGSAIERQTNYSDWLTYGLKNVIGDGLGNLPGLLDSAFMDILISLGWLGAITYMGGLIVLMLRLLRSSHLKSDTFGSTAKSIVIGMFAQLSFGSVHSGLPGMILWSFLGIGLAASRYQSPKSSFDLHSNISRKYKVK